MQKIVELENDLLVRGTGYNAMKRDFEG